MKPNKPGVPCVGMGAARGILDWNVPDAAAPVRAVRASGGDGGA
ncbi:hypothetical protein [Luteimonas sp. A482]